MRHRRVDGDDEIERRHGRRGVGEIAERRRKVDDAVAERRQHLGIPRPQLLLQGIQLHARHDEARQHGPG